MRRTATTREAIVVASLVVAVAAAPAVAWSAVQSIRNHTLITISEKGPLVVELGNNPLANGTYNAPLVGIRQPTGLAFVRAFPGQWFVLAWRKVFYFWACTTRRVERSPTGRRVALAGDDRPRAAGGVRCPRARRLAARLVPSCRSGCWAAMACAAGGACPLR